MSRSNAIFLPHRLHKLLRMRKIIHIMAAENSIRGKGSAASEISYTLPEITEITLEIACLQSKNEIKKCLTIRKIMNIFGNRHVTWTLVQTILR